MKYKSYKLKKLERNRYSILTSDLEHCYLCGKYPVDIHEIFGGANRQVSMKNGFCIPLCREHHREVTDNNYISLRLKQICQKEYEKTNSREEFMSLIGKNHL